MSVKSARAMKAHMVCILIALAAAAGFAEGSRERSSWDGGRSYHISNFTEVETGYGIEVRIEQSDEYRVTLYAERDFAERIEVEKVGETLRIRVLPAFPFFFSFGPHGRARVEISMPELERIHASGGAPVTLHMDEGNVNVAVELSGGSRIRGTLRCDTLSLGGSGGGGADLDGSAGELILSGSGGSVFDLRDFPVRDADVRLSGGSSARLMVTDDLSVRASGGSHATYQGSPSVHDQSLSGGSWIRSE